MRSCASTATTCARRVLPLLRARWPAAGATVARAARHAAEAQQLLDSVGAADAGRAAVGALLSAKVLRTLPPDRRRNALRFWIGAGGFQVPPTSLLRELAGPLLAARPDAQPYVAWEGVMRAAPGRPAVAARRAGRRPRGIPARGAPRGAGARRAPAGCRRRSGGCALSADAHGPLDLDALAPLLSVRVRRGGERLRPRRGGPRRTLKGLLQEARVPLAAARAPAARFSPATRWSRSPACGSTPRCRRARRAPHRGRLSWSGAD